MNIETILAAVFLSIPLILGVFYFGRAILFLVDETRRVQRQINTEGQLVSHPTPLGTFNKYPTDEEWVCDVITPLGPIPIFVLDADGVPDNRFMTRLPAFLESLPETDRLGRVRVLQEIGPVQPVKLVGITQEEHSGTSLDYETPAGAVHVVVRSGRVVGASIGG